MAVGKVLVAQEATKRRLYRSRDAQLAGVCAGIAEYCNFDAIVIRILAVLLELSTLGVSGLVYLFLWIYLPRAPEQPKPYDVTPEVVESSAYGHIDYQRASGILHHAVEEGPSFISRLAIAVALMLVFMVVAVNVTPILSGARWWEFWPLGLLMFGLCLVVIPFGITRVTAWHAAGIVVTSVGASLLPMSLGIVSWDTIPFAFMQLWVFVAVAAALFLLGFVRNVGPLMVTAAFCFASFCLISLLLYSIPGDADLLLVVASDGSYAVGLLNF